MNFGYGIAATPTKVYPQPKAPIDKWARGNA
jgi:hypothetical protein